MKMLSLELNHFRQYAPSATFQAFPAFDQICIPYCKKNECETFSARTRCNKYIV